MTPIVSLLARRFPDLVVEIASDDALTDIIAERFDAGVRLGGMIAQRYGRRPSDPALPRDHGRLARLSGGPKGEPQTIDDLAGHNCIGYRLIASGGLYAWDLQRDGEDVSLAVKGTMVVTDATYAKELALAGAGIAYLFEPLAREELRQGRLKWLLPHTAVEEPGLFLYYPRRASNAPKLRAFIEAAKEALAASR